MKKIKFLDYKNNFLGIKNPSNKKSKVYIVPYGLEKILHTERNFERTS